MPTPLSVGNVTFRERSVQPRKSRTGPDSLQVVLRGASDLLASELAQWTPGRTYPGYPNMFLDEAHATDRGPVSEIDLTFLGFLDGRALDRNGLIDQSQDTMLSSVQLTSSAGATVTASYYSQVSSFRWLARGARPSGPRFRGMVSAPRDVPPGFLHALSPPKFPGSIANAYRVVLRLTQFKIDELARGAAWPVTESWAVEIEPD